MRTATAAAICAVFLSSAAGAGGLEVRACALVRSGAASWQPVPEGARIDPGLLSFKRKVFLQSSGTMPVWAAEVRKALAAASRGLKPAERKATARLLDAVGEWFRAEIAVDPSPLGPPPAWRSATRVLKERRGNPFELVRALVAMLRAAGIPARPAFNGLPVACIFVTPPGKAGFWTVWDPLNPSASLFRLPVLWLPLRAGEVPLVVVSPAADFSPSVGGRRFASEEDARVAFAELSAGGRFPDGEASPISADQAEWWEVWSIGAALPEAPSGGFSMHFPLPFVIQPESRCGTVEQAVWVSDPAWQPGRLEVNNETDQQLGGILTTMKVRLAPAPVSATSHG